MKNTENSIQGNRPSTCETCPAFLATTAVLDLARQNHALASDALGDVIEIKVLALENTKTLLDEDRMLSHAKDIGSLLEQVNASKARQATLRAKVDQYDALIIDHERQLARMTDRCRGLRRYTLGAYALSICRSPESSLGVRIHFEKNKQAGTLDP